MHPGVAADNYALSETEAMHLLHRAGLTDLHAEHIHRDVLKRLPHSLHGKVSRKHKKKTHCTERLVEKRRKKTHCTERLVEKRRKKLTARKG